MKRFGWIWLFLLLIQVTIAGADGIMDQVPMVTIPRSVYPLFPKNPENRPPEMVQTVDSFMIARFEVTQSLFERVMGFNPSAFKGDETRPAERANWYQAIVFCNRLSMLAGLMPVYSINGSTNPDDWGKPPRDDGKGGWDPASGDYRAWDRIACAWENDGFRLPTDMEWRAAALGGFTGTGVEFAGDPDPSTPGSPADEYAWYAGNAGQGSVDSGTHTVGTRLPNAYGIFDMAGNVWEWCWDWVTGRGYYIGDKLNYRGPETGNGEKIRHGGSWGSAPYFAANGGHAPWCEEGDAGFRVARTIPSALTRDNLPRTVPRSTPAIVSPSIGTLRHVPAGSFHRGIDTASVSTISHGFYIGTTDVTHEQFLSVTGMPARRNTDYTTGDTDPVTRVSWYHALYFCNKLSIREGLRPVYSIGGSTNPDDWGMPPDRQNTPSASYDTVVADWEANGYRLPTEMEWMWAALGGRDSAAALGYCAGFFLGADVTRYAWFMENAGRKTLPVGLRQPNELGLFDMSGNVRQWVWDAFAPWPEGRLVDYAGPGLLTDRHVLKGGCWYSGSADIAIGSRFGGFQAGNWDVDTGFRVVRRE